MNRKRKENLENTGEQKETHPPCLRCVDTLPFCMWVILQMTICNSLSGNQCLFNHVFAYLCISPSNLRKEWYCSQCFVLNTQCTWLSLNGGRPPARGVGLMVGRGVHDAICLLLLCFNFFLSSSFCISSSLTGQQKKLNCKKDIRMFQVNSLFPL